MIIDEKQISQNLSTPRRGPVHERRGRVVSGCSVATCGRRRLMHTCCVCAASDLSGARVV